MASSSPRRASSPPTLPPVLFVSGMARSGTTFLFDTLRRILQMCPGADISALTFFDCVCYRHLVTLHREKRAGRIKRLIDAYFARAGIETRGMDRVAAASATVEEYVEE